MTEGTVSGRSPHPLGLLDTHVVVTDGLTAWIAANAPDLRVAVIARSWSDLIRETGVRPEVLIMDEQPGDSVALEARIRICLTAGTAVVVAGDTESPELERRVRAAGAAAYVSKTRPASQLIDAARRALARRTAAGVAWDEPAGRTGPAGATTEPAAGSPSATAPAAIRFSEDEEETLRLYASGHSPVEVAMVLGTNIQAVKNSLQRVREQYNSEGRNADKKQDLMRRAAEDGYLA